ncbi:MAG: SH3 domain-containing protein [Gammaproteobacteria bacterium]
MNARIRFAALALACVAPCVHAETRYVIEQLYVTVNAAADGTGERVAQIKSGDKVELLDRDGDQAHVRLPSGDEGWVKASYLSADLPLQLQLDTRSEELERARKEKTQLEADLAAAKRAPSLSPARTQPQPAPAPMPAAVPAPVEQPTPVETAAAEPTTDGAPPLFGGNSHTPNRPTWLWALGSSLVALALGFLLGWRMLDRRIRAKYGGLRIY